MAHIPFDSTFAAAIEGYRFISKRCKRYNVDVFQTRFLLQKMICMRGEAAARIFYDTTYFERSGVAPKFIQSTLFGHGGVQGMDGEAHRNRKLLFMGLMEPENINQLAELSVEQWREYAKKWEKRDKIILFHQIEQLICQAVCSWAGVPLKKEEVIYRAKDLAAMIDGAGSIGIQHWKARRARNRTELWIRDLIENVRKSNIKASEGSALHAAAWHSNLEGELLDSQIAAVELINILRPTVAVARFIIFAALALHKYPKCAKRLQEHDATYLTSFVHEVRRFYPFFPFVMARVRKDFEWDGYFFPKGRRALLDLYGTNHDPRLWENPEEFNPERFAHRETGAFGFIPQGGGDHYKNHRCPGEWIAIELMKAGVRFLLNDIQYTVPEQNLNIRLSRIPAIPASRFIITDVKCIWKGL